MDIRCPDCCSPEVEPDSGRPAEALHCRNCGAQFQRDSALVTVLDAERAPRDPVPQPLFIFDQKLAAIEARRGDAAITTVSPHPDAVELHTLLDGAQAVGIVVGKRERVAIHIYPLAIGDPTALLAVDLGTGQTLLGSELGLRQDRREDPVTYTVSLLEEIVVQANGLAAEHGADAACLDRIVEFMNRPGQWNGGDVCEVVATELVRSGRQLAED